MSSAAVGGREHWDRTYAARSPDGLSWFQREAAFSMRLIRSAGASTNSRIIDIGGGTSCLPRELLDAGFRHITVLDISPVALQRARQVLGGRADRISWIEGDVTRDSVAGPYDIWHDRAVLHFLIDPGDRARYRDALLGALALGGQAIIATFAIDGPERCSGLPIMRYDSELINETLGAALELVETQTEDHVTPGGMVQRFAWFRMRRREDGREAR